MLRPMEMPSSTWRRPGFGLVALALTLTLASCSYVDARDSPDATHTTPSSSATSSATATTTGPANDEQAPPPTNAEVSDRARTALTMAGAQRLVPVPGHEREVNTGFDAVWRGESLTAYVVPTSALPPASEPSELRVVGRRQVSGRAVEVVLGEDNTVRMLRFERGPDTWLLTALVTMTRSDELVGALLS